MSEHISKEFEPMILMRSRNILYARTEIIFRLYVFKPKLFSIDRLYENCKNDLSFLVSDANGCNNHCTNQNCIPFSVHYRENCIRP